MIKPNLEMTEYRALPGLSKHQLDAFAVAPAYYQWKLTQDFKPSRSMELGTLVHSQALEGRIDYAVGPQVDRRTTAGKAEWQNFCEANIGKIIVNEQEAAQIRGACEAVKPLLAQIKIKHVEASMFWERDGVECKGRPDIIGKSLTGEEFIVDLKTVTGIQNFDSSFFRLRYDSQAEWYQYGINKITGLYHFFGFIVVDMEAPHLCQAVYPSTELMEQAHDRTTEELAAFRACTAENVWPGLPPSRIIVSRGF